MRKDDVELAGDVEKLAGDPVFLIGVRHHSPSLARVLPELLTHAQPDALVLEMPAEAAPWCEWIAHPKTVAPLAFALADEDKGISFWPLADFSPELVALRWARAHDVPVVCADVSPARSPAGSPEASISEVSPGVGEFLDAYVRAEHHDDVWDRLVEVPSIEASADAVRRSALAFGLAYRHDQHVDARTAAREASMREGIRRARITHGPRVVAVTGAWHSPALTAQHIKDNEKTDAALLSELHTQREHAEATASLVPYSHALLDSRSGYPSGIRDPLWQQAVLNHGDDLAAFENAVATFLTRIASGLRAAGHPAGPGEIREAHRMTLDLAALRAIPAPGRRELLEACTSVYAQGDVLGRGRAVAHVAQDVLVGTHRGKLAPGTPESGLATDFRTHVEQLRLPRSGEEQKTVTLEPLRTKASAPRDNLDTRREVFLQRCKLAGIVYAADDHVVGVGNAQAVSTRWYVQHSAATDASVARAAIYGITVKQAAEGKLRWRRKAAADDPEALIAGLSDAAAAGLLTEFDWWLQEATTTLLERAGVDTLVETLNSLLAIREGTVAGMLGAGREAAIAEVVDALARAAAAQVSGLAGSDDPADAAALGKLVALQHADLGMRLAHTLREFVLDASPLMQGAAAALLHRLDAQPEDLPTIAAHIRAAAGPAARRALSRWLTGFLSASPELLIDAAVLLENLRHGVEDLEEALFIARLPALRAGFDPLSAAERERLMVALGADRTRPPAVAAEELGRWAEEDHAAWERLQRLGLASVALTPAQRWSLVLGRRRHELTEPTHRRLARSLDQLYGSGDREGSTATSLGGRGGLEPAYPTAREWVKDLDALFGEEVREDVAATAVSRRNPLAMELLADTQPRASVELLHDVLALAGGMPESILAKLRPMLRRMVEELSQVLANQLRPALRGLQGWRRGTRPSSRLDPVGTIQHNLRHTVPSADGRPQLVLATPIFRQPIARRSQWHVIVLVDVSGSMEPSTVFAALTASILAGVDALSVTFLAFSTEVIDLSEHVSDPLSLLLEIQVGGGTDIAHAMGVAQERVRVPSRTLLVVISDFEEGGSVDELLARTASLQTAGVRLLGCAALDDTGQARYNAAIAGQLAGAGMAVSAVSPTALARWVAEQVAT